MAEDALAVAGGQSGDLVRTARKNIAGRDVHVPYSVQDNPWTVWGSYVTSFAITAGAIGANRIMAGILSQTFDVVLRRIVVAWANTAAAENNVVQVSRVGNLAANAGTPLTESGIFNTQSGGPTPLANALVIPTPSGTFAWSGQESIGQKPATSGAADSMVRDWAADDPNTALIAQEALGEAFLISLLNPPNTNCMWTISLAWQEINQ